MTEKRSESIMTEKEEETSYVKLQMDAQARLRDYILERFAPASVVKEIGGLVKMCVN